jgi:hypothetical protein
LSGFFVALNYGYIVKIHKIMKILEKIKANQGMITLVLCAILFLKQCGISRDQTKITKSVKSIESRLDSIPTSSDLDKMIKIEGLKSSKRVLYDWNSVVRTAVRPDDRMNEYDVEIEKLEKKK